MTAYGQSCASLLTVDGQADGIAGAVTDGVEHVTPERSLVVAGHVVDDQRRSFVGDVNSVADGDLGGAVEPEEGDGRAGGGAGETHGAAGLHQASTRLRHRDS